MQDELMSKATKRNWKRLSKNINAFENKLTKRANKRLSTKKIIPVEYFENTKTRSFIKDFSAYRNIKSVLYSLAINLLKLNGLVNFKNNIVQTDNKYLAKILNDYNADILPELVKFELPSDERDILGLVYQMYLSEGSKNKIGSYYTPKTVLNDIITEINPTDTFLDPCCGAGSFLLAASDKIENPENIYGCDLDENACFISKINLIIKFKNKIFEPKIYNMDFLTKNKKFPKFDVIATNPPWGAVDKPVYKNKFPKIKSGETFSYFIFHSKKYLSEKGKMFFVLPESVLNVKVHQDIRDFILKNFCINKIKLHGRVFAAVLSKVVTLHLHKIKSDNTIKLETKDKILHINQNFYKKNTNNNFSILDNKDVKILEKIYSIPHTNLDDSSVWGLGIVTGNNAEHIFKDVSAGEKIYSGKNIQKNLITDTDFYINYDRTRFQQVAREEIYRAKEKLVYKFISKRPVFAYDDKQRLFLNSANILIPKIANYDIKTVMQFLNSSLFEYIYTKKFDEIKILKGNLMELPFPIFDEKKYPKITDDIIFEIFQLNQEEINYIRTSI